MGNQSENKPKIYLSKSKFLHGLQCPKLLWYEINRKEEMPAVTPQTQALFDMGHKIGELAQQLFPGGIKIERELFPEKHHQKSLEALKLRKPLFEAGFVSERTYALADVLVLIVGKEYELYEVKATTSVKDEHLYDLAFQKYTYEKAGIKIHNCFLVHINNKYVRKGEIDPRELFLAEEITKAVEPVVSEIEDDVARLLKVIESPKPPNVKIGPQCDSPTTCPLKDICWEFLPPYNVTMLYYGGKLGFELIDQGILKIADIPESVNLNDKQRIQVKALRENKVHIDKTQIRKFIDRLIYPLYFLDFETINPGIPVYDYSRPFEDIPFQYSLHVIRKEGEKPEHHSFLAAGDCDPRPEIIKKLQVLLGKSGSIVAYNANFEKDALKSAVANFPEYQNWYEGIEPRFVDLLEPFRNFYYYHPEQKKGVSLKSVLPAITGISYDNLEIAEGTTASNEYFRITFDANVAEAERQRVRAALEKYCALDTEAMIEIIKVLQRDSK